MVDGFLVAMLATIAMAVAWPHLGAAGGLLPMGAISDIGIGFVFFLHGASMSRQALRSGAANWRLHAFIQASTFVLFPLVGLAVFFTTRDVLPPELRLGVFFLCAICSTISSSVAMVGIARGNVSAAIFDATLSGLIGMVLTPLLLALVGATAGRHLSLWSSVVDIAVKLLLPFAAGQLLHPWLKPILTPHKAWVNRLDRSVILLIVYSSFCDSTAGGLWTRYDVGTLLLILAMVAALLGGVLAITSHLSRRLGFTVEDEITAVFCGSKKSLANGAPIAKILFGASPSMGMILLPLLLYHQLQLIVCSIIAKRYAQRPTEPAISPPVSPPRHGAAVLSSGG